MRPIATVAILIATTFLLSAADQVDPRFEKWRESSHQIFATHHLIAYVRLAHIDRKGAPFEFRYDRYPDGPERVQRSNGAALARKRARSGSSPTIGAKLATRWIRAWPSKPKG